MSLKSILLDLATIGAVKIEDAQQREYEIFRINQAAQELYDNYDLVGSLREQVFDVDVTREGNQIALPSYVGKLRAVRYYYPDLNLGIVDKRPKYQSTFWQGKNFLNWRLRGEFPLKTDISNEGSLTVTFKQPVTTPVEVTITGKTEHSSNAFETLYFNNGDTSYTTTKTWEEITSISKNVTTDYDLEVTDLNGRVLAEIANNQLKSNYQVVQIINLPNSATTYTPITSQVEVLWKARFTPFVNLTDEFQCNGYDKAIVWKRLEHRASTSSDPIEVQKALGYSAKATDIIERVSQDTEKILDKVMNFAPNQYIGVFEDMKNDHFPGRVANPCPRI